MKKSNVLMVVCAVVLAASSTVKAEEIRVNFDGGIKQETSIGVIMRALPEFEQALPTVSSIEIAPGKYMLYKLGTSKRQMLRSILSHEETALNDKNIQTLVNNEKIDVLYGPKVVLFVSSTGKNKYNTLLESNNLVLIDALRNLSSAEIGQNKNAVLICEMVEVIVTHYLWKWVDSVWTKVAVDVVELVKQCHQEEGHATDGGIGGPDCSDGPQRQLK